MKATEGCLNPKSEIRNKLVSGARPMTPKGSSRIAQGVSPGFKVEIAKSPERAAHGVLSQLIANFRRMRPFRASIFWCTFSQGLRPHPYTQVGRVYRSGAF